MNVPSVVELPSRLDFSTRPAALELAPLPGCPAVYLLLDSAGQAVQLATTQHLRRAVMARLSEPPADEKTKRADLAEIVRAVAWRPVACALEARWWYWRFARRLHADDYRDRIDFGPAWFLHVDWSVAVPELRVSERIWRLPGEFIGPWPTHKSAQQALEGLWDLFDLCRYPEQVRKMPNGTRCSYAEMDRCDAPCDGSVPIVAYVARCRSAWSFAGGDVAAWLAEAQVRMRDAAAALRFELAAQIKQQVAFARDWRTFAQPRVHRDTELRCVIAHRVARRRACKLFWFDRGSLADGPIVASRRWQAQLNDWLTTVSSREGMADSDSERMEQTWLLARLFLSESTSDFAIVWIDANRSPADECERISVATERLLVQKSA